MSDEVFIDKKSKLMVIVRDNKTNKIIQSKTLSIGDNFNLDKKYKAVRNESYGTIYEMWVDKI